MIFAFFYLSKSLGMFGFSWRENYIWVKFELYVRILFIGTANISEIFEITKYKISDSAVLGL